MDGPRRPDGGEKQDSPSEDFLREVARVDERAPPPREPESVQRFGHFRILGELGRGGMGVVYKATDEKLRRTVALKVLPPELANEPERRQRFLREAHSLAAVTHANIATLYDVGEADGRVFLVMEYIEGKSLRATLRAGPLPLPSVLHVARGVARALVKAHAGGIIHRDLKPDNVILSNDDEVKVLDFGLAKLREADTKTILELADTEARVTQEGRVLGTPGYMSPEQGRGKEVDARTDLFSLGVMLYEMLTGVRPFQGETSFDVLVAVSRDTPEPLHKRAPTVPPELVAIVERCMAKAPEGRYASARELLALLDALPGGSRLSVPVSAPSTTVPATMIDQAAPLAVKSDLAVETHPAPKSRRRWLNVLVALLALLLFRRLHVCGTGGDGGGGGGGGEAESHASASHGKGRAITDYRAPKTNNPEAAAAYAIALKSLRDASLALGNEKLSQAAKLDPTLAAAHLRIVLYQFGNTTTELRRQYAAAAQFVDNLDDRDEDLLPVAEAYTADRVDWAQVEHRLRAAEDDHPKDAEIELLLARTESLLGKNDEAQVAANRALELDPHFAAVLWAEGQSAEERDPNEALHLFDRCLELAPDAGSCLRARAHIHEARGECPEFEADARRMTQVEPEGQRPYEFLAAALAARNAPVESVRTALDKMVALARATPTTGAVWSSETVGDVEELWLALLRGDMTATESLSVAVEHKHEGDPSESAHADAALGQMFALEERGEVEKALAVGDAFERRLPAWTPDSPWVLRLHLVYLRHATGRLGDDAFRKARDTLLAEVAQSTPPAQAEEQQRGYALVWSETPQEAADSLKLTEGHPIPPHIGLEAVALGKAYWLVGRVDEALPLLRKAASSCSILPRVDFGVTIGTYFWMRAHTLLGQALETKGDKAGACDAYRVVVDRWKNATPRSITLEKAKARSKALGC